MCKRDFKKGKKVMKKLVLVFFIFISSLLASEINWSKDITAAMLKAQKESKPVLFIISRHTCRFCIKLANTTLKDQKVADELNKNFSMAIAHIDDNDFVPRDLMTQGVPAIWFLLPSGEPMYQPLMGAMAPDDFLQALTIVKEDYKEYLKEKK